MEIEDYPHCCAAKILYRFGYSASAFYSSEDISPEDHETQPKPDRDQVLNELCHYKNVFSKLGLFTIILDQIQKDAIGTWLEEAGAQLLAKANNAKQGNSPIYLYVIILNEAS